MPAKPARYKITAKLWRWSGAKASWFFFTVPERESDSIKAKTFHKKRGWGSVRVRVTIGKTKWETSIFPDGKTGTYVLPVKAEVRKREGLKEGTTVAVTIELSV